MSTRRAVVGDTNPERVARYLPANYYLTGETTPDGLVVIEGEDRAGWTLDGYVPRLASGLIGCREVTR